MGTTGETKRPGAKQHSAPGDSVLDPAEAARVLGAVYTLAAACSVAIALVGLFSLDGRVTTLGVSGGATFGLLLVLARRGNVSVAGGLGIGGVLLLVVLSMITGHGIRDLSYPVFGFVMLLANLVLVERWAHFATIGTWLLAVAIAAAEAIGLFQTEMSFATTWTQVVIIGIFNLAMALTARRLVRAFHAGLEHAQIQELSYRHIFNATSEAIFLIDPVTERILDVNRSAQTMFGFSRQEFLRSSLQQLAGRHQSVDHVVNMMEIGAQGDPLLFEWKITSKSGQEKPVEVSLRPAVVGAQNVLLAVVRDASETRRIQAKLQESEKLQAVGQLAGGIAHDFNNQLTGILANASLLQEKITDPRLARCAEIIVRCSRRSSDLTAQLLAFARRGKHQNVNVDIHELVAEVVELLKHTIDKRIVLETHLCNEDLQVMGDPTLLQNALLNLGLNACDAMPQGGTLSFSTALHFVEHTHAGMSSAVRHGSYVKVVVADTGEGMNDSTRRRIFEPFFTTKESGNGMGLAAVYGAVESHRGDISLESELGRGTSFTMLLPLSESPSDSVTLKVISPYRQFPGTRILLAEDEGDVAHAITLLLEEMGCSVIHCQDGQAALEAFRATPELFDLVILDHMMPRLSGRELLVEMRKVRPCVRALLTSGYSTETVIEHSEHPEAFLPKPFNQVQLGIMMARVLESPQEASTVK